MQPGAQAMRLRLPLRLALELSGEVRLPERDVAHPADAKHRHQLAALLLQFTNLLGITRQLAFEREVPLVLRYGGGAEWAIERLLHRILECAGIIRGQRVALGVGP